MSVFPAHPVENLEGFFVKLLWHSTLDEKEG